mmetsp:Transcript_24115/g.46124  ORF Transcript_24115/g.46124 Transcript_24115/m.46124 type:complete len:570 (-) Transcript_24115:848-2557(-)
MMMLILWMMEIRTGMPGGMHNRLASRTSGADAIVSLLIGLRSKFLCDEFLEGGRIPSILDVVLGSRALKVLRADFDPSFAEDAVAFPQEKIILPTKWQMINRRIQMIHPPIPHLLPNPPRKLLRQITPPREWILYRILHRVHDDGILLVGPLSLSTTGLQVARPSLLTFPRGFAPPQLLGNWVPILWILELPHDFHQCCIVVLVPPRGAAGSPNVQKLRRYGRRQVVEVVPVVVMMRRSVRMVDVCSSGGRRARRMMKMMRGARGRRGVHRVDGRGRSAVQAAMVMRRRRRVVALVEMRRRRRRTVPSAARVRRVPVRRRRRIVTVVVIVVRILLRRVIQLPLSGMMAVTRGRRRTRPSAVLIVGMRSVLAGRIPRGIVVVVIVLRGRRRHPSRRRSSRRRRAGVAALARRQRRGRRQFHRRSAGSPLPRELDVRARGQTLALLAHLAEDALGTRIVVVVIEALAAVAIVVPVADLLLDAAVVVRPDGIGKAKGGQNPVLSEAAHAGHAAADAPSREGLPGRLPRGHGAQLEGSGAVMGVLGVRGDGTGGGRFGHDASVQRDVGDGSYP